MSRTHINIRYQKALLMLSVDILAICISIILTSWLKSTPIRTLAASYALPMCAFLAVWLLISAALGKYKYKGTQRTKWKVKIVLTANTTTFALCLSILYLFQITSYSRLVIFGTITITTLAELTLLLINYYIKSANLNFDHENKQSKKREFSQKHIHTQKYSPKIREEIIKEIGQKIFNFIERSTPFNEDEIYFTSTTSPFGIQPNTKQHHAIVNLTSLNKTNCIRGMLKTANKKLPLNGYIFLTAETTQERKESIYEKYPPIINNIMYLLDYITHRVLSKVTPFKHIYNKISHTNRALSKTELLGQLYATGFEVRNEAILDKKFVCTAEKTSSPPAVPAENTGPLIKLERYGKDRKIIRVYKFRTMHPYAQYLQSYIYNRNKLEEGGKFKDDFRISSLGRFMRKTWLDELPMFINLFKGEIKIVGVRPLSKQYFNLYSIELQELRTKHKPGLLPPFYADSPNTLEEIQASEMKYLQAYEKHPLKTDLTYLTRIFFNIIVKKRRSK